MSWIVRGMTMVLLLGAVPVLAQDKKKDGKTDPRSQQDLTPLVNAGVARGRVARVHNSSSFTLEVVQTTTQPGSGVVRGKGGLRAAPPRVVTTRKPYVLDVADDVVVRVMEMPLQFDEKGKPKPYTADELKELRGYNPNLPGYKCDYDSLRTGQVVDISFRRIQPLPAPDANADKDKPARVDNTPRVTLIVILSEGDSATAGRKADGKKKK